MLFKEKASYGIGAVGKDLVYMLVSSYILYYYESVLGVDAVFVGTVLMAARVFDAFNDPFMGIIVAKTRSRFGKFRPWILAGTVLNAVVLYGLFAFPEGMGNDSAKLWLVVVYILWGVTYTIMDIPYWSMIPAITTVGKERENVSSLAKSCAGIGSAIPTVLTMIVVPILGGGSAMANYRVGFKYWALIVAVFFVISEVICVLNVKEKNSDSIQVENKSVKEMFKSLFANDQAMVVVITIVLVNTALYLTSNLVIYYFQYDIGDQEAAYSLFSAFGGAAQILAMVLFPLFRKKLNKRNVFKLAAIGEIAGYILLLAIAFTGITSKSVSANGWMILFVPGFMIFFGSGLLNVLITIFLSDTIDYGQMKNNRRDESVIFSMQTFVVKLASGVAVFFAGTAIKLVGLKTGAGFGPAEQTFAALLKLRVVMTVIPIVGLIAAIVIFLRKYKLDEAMMEKVVKANEKL